MGIKAFHLLGKATDYDVEVAEKLAFVLSGGDCDMTSPLTEDDMLALETGSLCSAGKTTGYAGKTGAHAKNRQAVEELTTGRNKPVQTTAKTGVSGTPNTNYYQENINALVIRTTHHFMGFILLQNPNTLGYSGFRPVTRRLYHNLWLNSSVASVYGVDFLLFAIPLNIPFIRQQLFSRWVFKLMKGALPPMSQTEREALEAGNTWWDAELFSGNPDWKVLLDLPASRLSDEEQAFIDGPVETLCAMLNDWDITHNRKDLPQEVWALH